MLMNLETLWNNANSVILFSEFTAFVKVEIILQEYCDIEPEFQLYPHKKSSQVRKFPQDAV